MKVEKTLLVLVVSIVVLTFCLLPSKAQVAPKTVEIRPGTTVQWSNENNLIITTTVSQSVKTKDLWRQKQRLLDQIGRLQGEVSRLQAEVTYLDSILNSYSDPNEP